MIRRTTLLFVCVLVCNLTSASEPDESKTIDFANDIRPILSDACFACHGPDEESREADLRLDVPDEALAVIEPGDWESSELVVRMLETDDDLIMPPPHSGKKLDTGQIELFKRWIQQGAEYEQHWAFSRPVRPPTPKTDDPSWIRNPVDAFVAEKRDAAGFPPSEPADDATLIRRLSIDLTGLPPEPDFVRTWKRRLIKQGDQGYRDLVNELLRSVHYGEHWGRYWLDAARYADSDGYEKDKPRTAWFYRDWVVQSLNEDRPYNDFIVRQIAGDLLPDATQNDRIATGFLRNSMVNEEGGADPEQFRMEAMFDRMDAIGKSILGLTVQCSQCHSHKYDPLQHEEYFGMFAFLNNTHDAIIPVYSDEEQVQRQAVLAEIVDLENTIKQQASDWRERLEKWAAERSSVAAPQWSAIELEFNDTSLSGSKFLPQGDGSYLCQGYAPTNFKPRGTGRFESDRLTGIQLEMLTHQNLPCSGPGRSVAGTWALSELTAEVYLSGSPEKKIPLKFKRAIGVREIDEAELKPRYNNKKDAKRITGGVSFAIDGDEKTAWTNEIDTPLANVDDTAWFELETPVEIPQGQHATFVVHLAQRHGGWNSDDNQTFNIGCFRVSLTSDELTSDELSDTTPLPQDVTAVVEKPFDQWSESELQKVFSFWRTTIEEFEPLNAKIAAAWEKHPQGTTQLTLAETSAPRKTSLLVRGDFLSPADEVKPHVPEFLHELEPSDEPGRLQFARWLASDQSPTTARSIVNRVWQAYFGIGLVETSDDLGTQSAPPSHQALLDFLAVELMENSWSLKHLHRLIVNSATYRQSSKMTPELAERDPYNRLLARGARFRVPAETVRDITLSASGLLNPKTGGPSVYPPAPEFLFKPPVSYGPKVWNVEQDDARYRRALYTFRFRSVPYPMLENFDAIPGNLSCVRRSTSNTPMQALTSLNEPMFLECAIALAAKTLREAEDDDLKRIGFAFERCTGRKPTDEERSVLQNYLKQQQERVNSGDLSADSLLSSYTLLDFSDLSPDQMAAWSLTCRVILNLDETITRE